MSGRRVCVVGAGPRFLSGISYYTLRLTNAFAREHRTSAVLMRQLLPARLYPGHARLGQPLSAQQFAPGVRVFDGVDWFWGASLLRALGLIWCERPDFVVFQWWTGTVLHSYLALAWLARWRGARVIIEFHEVLDTAEERVPLARAYVRALAPRLMALSDGFVVHARHDLVPVQARYDLAGKPFAVVPHGPYDQHTAHDTAPLRSAPADCCNVLFFGVIRPYKGLEDLIRAFGELSLAEAQGLWLTVVGETWEDWDLPARLIAENPHRERITFVNRYVPDSEVGAFFAGADAVALPYHRSSASGPLSVAMSHGLPVVVSAVGGLTEAVAGYSGARLVPPQDPAALREALHWAAAQRGQRFTDPHSWLQSIERFDALFGALSAPLSLIPPASFSPPGEPRMTTASPPGSESAATIAEHDAASFLPTQLLEVELSAPIPEVLPARDETGRPYWRGLSLVRLHSQPIGVVDLALAGGLSAETYARRIWDTLRPQIEAHLQADGLPLPQTLTARGLPITGTPACVAPRAEFLKRAPFVSVIIPTRERVEVLEPCLKSLFACEYPNFEVVIVDNNPQTDATRAFLEREYGGSERVRYVREDWSGSAAARNAGVRAARGEIVAFTDDDVLLDRYWLLDLARGFDEGEHVGCVTGLVMPMRLETPAQAWFEQYGGFGKGFARQVYDRSSRPENPLYPFTTGVFGIGNNMAFRRATLDAIGGFDPRLGNGTPALGGVDSEVLFRVVIQGHALVYQPSAIVHHLHRRTYEGLRKQIYNYGVGFTAFLTRSLIAEPRLIPDFIRKLPGGLAYAFDPRSAKNQKKQTDYPRELSGLELRGMVYGPLAYLRSALDFARRAGVKAQGGA